MWKNRLTFFLLLLTAGGLWLLDGSAYTAAVLWFTVTLPLLSAGLSLRGMLGFSASPSGCAQLHTGDSGYLLLAGRCAVPMLPFGGRILLTAALTGNAMRYDSEQSLDTRHCGGYCAQVRRGWVCDYLGLLSLPIRHREPFSFTVLPPALPWVGGPPPAVLWRRGGTEDFDLMPFRPGESLHSVHWKLSAKTGSLLLRVPLEQQKQEITLRLRSLGDARTLDRAYGRLLGAGRLLLAQEIPLRVQILTGSGIVSRSVENEAALAALIRQALLCPCAKPSQQFPAGKGWEYTVGGTLHG